LAAKQSQSLPSDEEDRLLAVAGEQIRASRALRGMSRKMVADQADVSERHLAMIEKGTGNVSIRLLGRIADALDIPAGHLLTPPPSQQFTLFSELLSRLSDGEQREAYQLVAKHFPQLQSPRRIVLVGLRGAGKTALGERLAHALHVPFRRLSGVVEYIAGMPMHEIHELVGQAGYRRLELQAAHQILAHGDDAVIEAGGSIVSNAPAYETLLRGAHVIWLKASAEEHMARVVQQGDLRPMGGREDAMDDLVAMLDERGPLYAHAHATLDTSDRTEDESFEALQRLSAERLVNG